MSDVCHLCGQEVPDISIHIFTCPMMDHTDAGTFATGILSSLMEKYEGEDLANVREN